MPSKDIRAADINPRIDLPAVEYDHRVGGEKVARHDAGRADLDHLARGQLDRVEPIPAVKELRR